MLDRDLSTGFRKTTQYLDAGWTWVVVATSAVVSLLGGAFAPVRQDITSLPGARSEFFAQIPGAFRPVARFALGPNYPLLQILGVVLTLSVVLVSLSDVRLMGQRDEDATSDTFGEGCGELTVELPL